MSGDDLEVVRKALEGIKLRMIFVGWPAEPMWSPHGTPVPDWREWFALAEAGLAALSRLEAQQPTGEQPTPPECPMRDALERAVRNFGGRDDDGPWESDARNALSTPCSSCPTAEPGHALAVKEAELILAREGRDALTRKVEKLLETLRPFASASTAYRRGAGRYAEATDSLRIVLANCDRAAALLVEHEKEQG